MKRRNVNTTPEQATETQVTETQATETQVTETQVTETQATGTQVVVPSEKLIGLTETINTLLSVQRRSDYAIAFTLNLIKKHHKEEIKNLGYKNVEEYAEAEFNFAKSTYHAYTKVSERFIQPAIETRKCLTGASDCFEISTVVGVGSFTVLKDIDGYEFSISQMLELLPLSDEELQEHIEEFFASDTTKRIREKVKGIKTAISTTATETEESQNECQDESQNECQDESQNECQDESQNEPMTDNKRILAILAIANDIENEDFRNSLVELLNSFING